MVPPSQTDACNCLHMYKQTKLNHFLPRSLGSGFPGTPGPVAASPPSSHHVALLAFPHTPRAHPPLNSLLLPSLRSSLRHHAVPEAVRSPHLRPSPSTSAPPSSPSITHSAHLTCCSFCCSPNGAGGIGEPVLAHACTPST